MQRKREDWTVAEYLDAVRRGDSTAPRRLDRCAKRLAASKARALHLSREDAEDAAQQAALVAFANDGAALARVGNARTSLSSWVAGVISHLLTRLVEARASAELATPLLRVTQRSEQRARVAAERSGRLNPTCWSRLDELTPSRQHAFRLHLQGFSINEIATRLGSSQGAIRERIRGAWVQLKADPRSSVRAQVAALLAHGRAALDAAEVETLLALTSGKSYRQIARDRSESSEAVRSRVRRALRRSADLLREGTPQECRSDAE